MSNDRWSPSDGKERRMDRAKRPGHLVLIASVCAGLAACNEEKKVVVAPQPVQVITVAMEPQVETWALTGTVRPRYESDLGFRVAGKIVERLVDVGQVVAAGQPLARLDATDFQLNVLSQEAELRAALSSRDQAVASEQRYVTLLEKGYVAKAALEQRIASADEARSRVDRAQRGLDLARNQLSYVALKADRAGVVSAMPIEAGQVVTAGQLVARIARMDTLEAQVAIPEQRLDAVRAAGAEVELWGASARRFKGTLREMAPEADRVSRTYQARFVIESPDGNVQLGRTVTVHLTHGDNFQVAKLPLSAVMSDGRGSTVWVVDTTGARVLRKPVDVLGLTKEHAIIKSGVAAGDRVVTLGVHMLDEAKPIRVLERRADLK